MWGKGIEKIAEKGGIFNGRAEGEKAFALVVGQGLWEAVEKNYVNPLVILKKYDTIGERRKCKSPEKYETSTKGT